MDARRRRWIAAVLLFLVWVTALGAMALVSGRSPAPRPKVLAPR
jgi:hypothetical protein